jgi:hypothetical protein
MIFYTRDGVSRLSLTAGGADRRRWQRDERMRRGTTRSDRHRTSSREQALSVQQFGAAPRLICSRAPDCSVCHASRSGAGLHRQLFTARLHGIFFRGLLFFVANRYRGLVLVGNYLQLLSGFKKILFSKELHTILQVYFFKEQSWWS